jgi:LmbE family N-acetylglucosaminyl deacetylase
MLAQPEVPDDIREPGTVPFPGGVLLVAPHMDDETLGCGALLTSFDWNGRMHVAFATDGALSPVETAASPSIELPGIRRREALAAMAVLGVEDSNVHFLDLPDGGLRSHTSRLATRLRELVDRTRPAFLLVPFRYDRHPDHLAINHVAVHLVREDRSRQLRLIEYFVYARWRLLPSGDVRRCLRPGRGVEIRPDAAAMRKRMALACYRSQTTLFYPWQKRPILTNELVNRVCAEPETFVVHGPASFERKVFARSRGWIPVAHRIEPVLKRGKDRVVEWLQR